MFNKLLTSTVVVILASHLCNGEHGVLRNHIQAQYFIGTFNGAEFPLALDQCNPLDIFGANGYQMATCIDEDTVAWYYYGSSDCETAVGYAEYNTSYKNGYGTYLDFNCDDDAYTAYTEIEFAAFSCDSTKVTMYAAVGSNTCSYLSESDTSILVYCEEDFASLYYFDNDEYDGYGASCSNKYLYNSGNATNECGFMIKTSGIKVYGQVVDCSLPQNITTTTTTTTSTTTTEGPTTTSDSDSESSDSDSGSGSVNTTTIESKSSDSDSGSANVNATDSGDDNKKDDSNKLFCGIAFIVSFIFVLLQ